MSIQKKKKIKPPTKNPENKLVYLSSSLFSKPFKHTKAPLELQDILK